MLYAIFQGRDSLLILRRIRDWNAQEIETNLRTAFAETESTIPLDVLANYLAWAQIALILVAGEAPTSRARKPGADVPPFAACRYS